MNALQAKYGEKLVILGFPCNQFGLQEPAKNHTELINGVKYVRPGDGFTPNFTLLSKVEVNGDNEIPLYTYLKKHCPATRDGFSDKSLLFYHPFKNWDVRWNWEKFLVDQRGRPYMRYDPSSEPLEQISADIEGLLKAEH